MKKRLFSSILAAAMLLSVVGCSSTPSHSSSQSTNEASSSVPSSASNAEGEVVIPDDFPESVTYTGTGDDVITLEPFEGVWVMTITGNDQAAHFAVKGYDAGGNYTDLFVNTTEPYCGTTIDPYFETETLEVSATGTWKVEIRSIFEMDTIAQGETYSGNGDAILLATSFGKTARIVGNPNSNHFAVKSYGDTYELLVNTTDPYEGTVMLKGNPTVLAITAESDWSITFN